MKINIFGSTGEIGSKSLSIIKKYFPSIKINLLSANKNYQKLITQSIIFQPKYVSINDKSKILFLKKKLNKYKIKILYSDELKDYLKKSKSDLSILAISGYNSINFLKEIFINTKHLGLVNKEAIVSAGHLFKKLININKVSIHPLDSEHYSIHNYFKKNYKNNDTLIKNIFLTASGGPFLKTNLKKFSKINFTEATKHPKWKMGFKNSIDSATLANKSLEIIEAHYLFNIEYNKLKVVIHPEALVHSIIEHHDLTSEFNYFFPDMFIPIFNFFNNFVKDKVVVKNKFYDFNFNSTLNFQEVDFSRYPVYKIFTEINKSSHQEIIKFNIANELAVDKFKVGNIKFNEIHLFISKCLSFNFTHETNSINDVVNFHKNYNVFIKNEKF